MALQRQIDNNERFRLATAGLWCHLIKKGLPDCPDSRAFSAGLFLADKGIYILSYHPETVLAYVSENMYDFMKKANHSEDICLLLRRWQVIGNDARNCEEVYYNKHSNL